MKDEILNILKEDLIIKISFFFILFFPVILLVSTSIVNTSIVAMNLFFLAHVIKEKKISNFQ